MMQAYGLFLRGTLAVLHNNLYQIHEILLTNTDFVLEAIIKSFQILSNVRLSIILPSALNGQLLTGT
jgi:hypothetical protein